MTAVAPGGMETVELAVIGAGAAGLMAAICAGRAATGRSIVVLDSARKLGAKILVSGGGRCNVTHDQVDETAFCGSSRPAIRRVLRRFHVPDTIAFFADLGVELSREETGKLFPATGRAGTVLEALLSAARGAGARLSHPCRVEAVLREKQGFLVSGPAQGAARWGALRAKQVILATGGRSLPKSGSDGHGFDIARSLGHTTTPRIFPALVPLTLAAGSFIRGLSGVSARVTIDAKTGAGRRIASLTDSILCAHFGVSGPAALDISRHFIDAAADDPGARLTVNWLPGETMESVDGMLRGLGAISPGRWLRGRLPERLARALCDEAGVDPSVPGCRLTRERRRVLACLLVETTLPVAGHRGFTHAEVTAGGVPLSEIHLDTMRSRRQPGLSLCGEILDVDGRIGGHNFQWAWAGGYVAGISIWT